MTLLHAHGLGFAVAGRWLLRDVDLEVAAGEVVAVVGPNGAGKSTLLRLLAREITAAEGTAILGGRPLDAWEPTALARHRAVVPQHTRLEFPFRVHEVVRLGRAPHEGTRKPAEEHRIVERAMRRADVLHLAERVFPTLSGGERQRVAWARALAQVDGVDGGRLLLLDEPTASLDPRHQHDVLELARELARAGTGVLAVLHDLNLACSYADRVILVAAGRVVAAGPPAHALTASRIRDVFAVEVSVLEHPTAPVPLIVSLGAIHQETAS